MTATEQAPVRVAAEGISRLPGANWLNGLRAARAAFASVDVEGLAGQERALPSHHLAEDLREATEAIVRVRAQFVRMTKSSDEKTRNHGTALLHILDGTQ